jgi:hypothetical protein
MIEFFHVKYVLPIFRKGGSTKLPVCVLRNQASKRLLWITPSVNLELFQS